jgi:hypothetical protein
VPAAQVTFLRDYSSWAENIEDSVLRMMMLYLATSLAFLVLFLGSYPYSAGVFANPDVYSKEREIIFDQSIKGIYLALLKLI